MEAVVALQYDPAAHPSETAKTECLCASLKGFCSKQHLHLQVIICRTYNPVTLAAGHTMVADVLDMGQSDEGMLVAYGVCRELDDMKNTYNSLPDYLTKVRLAQRHG